MRELSIAPAVESPDPVAPQINAAKLEQMMQDIKANQSIGMGIAGGFAASVIAAFIWSGITYITNMQIGYMAIGVGFLVGLAVRHLGKGIDFKFGLAGASFSLFGCLLGNLLVVMISASQIEGISVFQILSVLLTTPTVIIEIYKESFSPIDLLFYGIAIYAGYRYGIMEISEDELESIQTPPPPQSPGGAV